MDVKATEIEEQARMLWEMSGNRAIAEAAQKALALEEAGDKEGAHVWRRIESALMLMSGPRST